MIPVTVKIVDRDETHARYFVYSEDGRELRQTHRDVTKELALSRRRHQSLQKVLEEVEGR